MRCCEYPKTSLEEESQPCCWVYLWQAWFFLYTSVTQFPRPFLVVTGISSVALNYLLSPCVICPSASSAQAQYLHVHQSNWHIMLWFLLFYQTVLLGCEQPKGLTVCIIQFCGLTVLSKVLGACLQINERISLCLPCSLSLCLDREREPHGIISRSWKRFLSW